MRFLALILLMAHEISINSQEVISNIEVKPAPQAGIFYEPLQNLRFIHHHWRIVIMIDVLIPHVKLRPYENHVAEMAKRSGEIDANETLIYELKYQINKKFKAAREYFQVIRLM